MQTLAEYLPTTHYPTPEDVRRIIGDPRKCITMGTLEDAKKELAKWGTGQEVKNA